MVFLANDWHAGLVPTYIAGKYRQHGVYKVRLLSHFSEYDFSCQTHICRKKHAFLAGPLLLQLCTLTMCTFDVIVS